MMIASEVLPEYRQLFNSSFQNSPNITGVGARSVIEHLLKIIKLEKDSNSLIKNMKIFESGEEKLKQAGLTFKSEDYVSTFNNLNSAFELIIKDKIGIPTTIPNINTSNIIEVLVKHKIEPYLYLNEVRKRVTDMDNKVKHQGYSPSKIDAINGITAMKNLISHLRKIELNLPDEVRSKICEGL